MVIRSMGLVAAMFLLVPNKWGTDYFENKSSSSVLPQQRTSRRGGIGLGTSNRTQHVDAVLNYIDKVFPPLYLLTVDTSLWTSMYREILKNHPYITIFIVSTDDSLKRKIISGIELLTVQSMMMFMMALFFDLEVCIVHTFNL